LAKLLNAAGLIVISAFISPFKIDRERAAEVIGKEHFIEVFVDADLQTCRERDPKGLYKKADAGLISNFTGIDSPYEIPELPALVLKTAERSVSECRDRIINKLAEMKLIGKIK
ncbi:MAG: adenylyl-sulfate kinase, partial [Victivallales bacterium]|nr:adenylyl-sulfate kinase [Victivallales bacterium]